MSGWLSDREGLVHVKGKMYVAVRVIGESRQSWGRTQLQVEPIEGTGDTWIDESTLEELANLHLAASAPELLKALENAYADINWLLAEGFDTNADECNIDGVRDTLADIKQAIATAKEGA